MPRPLARTLYTSFANFRSNLILNIFDGVRIKGSRRKGIVHSHSYRYANRFIDFVMKDSREKRFNF